MSFTEPIKAPIVVGSMLFSLVEPHKGHEVAYNRWYERDHFYGGAMVGPWLFAGRRWVATRPLKDLRYPIDSPIASPVQAGSYLHVYWILKGHDEDHQAWSSPQARWLNAHGRGFSERTHVHTLFYRREWRHHRDPDPVPLELSLHHDYAGLVMLILERDEGIDQSQVDTWFRERYLPGWLEGSPVASASAWSPFPQPERLAGDNLPTIPRLPHPERTRTLLFFLDTDPRPAWDRFVRLGQDFDQTGLGRVLIAAPFIPAIMGTDTYIDQLW